LSAFLKENFTVDWEKEKARLDGYREINPADYAGSGPVAVNRPAAPAATSFEIDDDSAFASSPMTEPFSPPPTHTPNAGIRAAAAVNPVRTETTANTATNVPLDRGAVPATTKPPSRAPKLFAAALGLTLLLGAGAAAAWKFLLQPVTTLVLTVVGPQKAHVRFDGQPPVEVQSSTSFDKVEKGQHSIIVEAPGYIPSTLTVVTDGDAVMQLKAVMKRVPGKLTVTSDPSGAAITLDGKPTDKHTPASFDVDGDSIHEVRLDLPDYKQGVKGNVRVAGGAEQVERIKLLPSVVHLRIISVPEGAMLKVGGIDFGMTPTVIDRAPDDPYPEVEFTHPGCAPLKSTAPFDREKAEDRFAVNLKCR
jgi:hypothetical protein